MNILVIGNGFDLAHELPTKYGNFLDFCERARRIYTFPEHVSLNDYKSSNIEDWKINDYIKNALLDAFDKRDCKKDFNVDGTLNWKVTVPNKYLNELYGYIEQNTWLEYFLKRQSSLGDNWIDFESEISQVIRPWMKR